MLNIIGLLLSVRHSGLPQQVRGAMFRLVVQRRVSYVAVMERDRPTAVEVQKHPRIRPVPNVGKACWHETPVRDGVQSGWTAVEKPLKLRFGAAPELPGAPVLD